MPLEVSVQVSIIICSLLAGVITGVLFDVYRLIRGRNVPKVIVIVEDILFWALIAVTIFAFLLYSDYAFLSVYVYVFIGVALLLYLKLISPLFIKVEENIFRSIYKILRILTKTIFYPIKLLYNILCGKNKGNKKMS